MQCPTLSVQTVNAKSMGVLKHPQVKREEGHQGSYRRVSSKAIRNAYAQHKYLAN